MLRPDITAAYFSYKYLQVIFLERSIPYVDSYIIFFAKLNKYFFTLFPRIWDKLSILSNKKLLPAFLLPITKANAI